MATICNFIRALRHVTLHPSVVSCQCKFCESPPGLAPATGMGSLQWRASGSLSLAKLLDVKHVRELLYLQITIVRYTCRMSEFEHVMTFKAWQMKFATAGFSQNVFERISYANGAVVKFQQFHWDCTLGMSARPMPRWTSLMLFTLLAVFLACAAQGNKCTVRKRDNLRR